MKLPGHISLLFTMLTILLAGCNNRPADTDWPEQTIENKPWTRWWWMGNDVDSANLTYNLEMLSQAGIGGVEITPIYGVKGREKHYIDYLSPKWMNMLGFTLTEAARLGMGVDMNNGTGWPFGGPMVSVEDAATRALFREYSLSGGESLPEPVKVTEILPAVKQIPLATMEQINRLIEQGATILFSKHYPSDVPGLYELDKRSEQLQNLLSRLPQVESFETTGQHKMGKGSVITGSDYSSMLSLWDENREQFVHELGGQLVRRKHEKGHIYFLAMLQNNPVNGWVTLGVNAESALFFDPMSGRKGVAALRNNNGRTEIYLQLKPGESMIIKTFNDPVKAEKWNYDQPADRALQLERGWQLSFIESKPAIEETFTLDSLISWTELGHEELQRNMGTGRYSLTFEIHKNPAAEYLLSLGDVRESAVVRINGEVADTLYAVPFETQIGSLLKEGKNKIEIDVTNLPANRIADYDRRGVEWRIFHEINFVSITYQPTKFDIWEVVPSGLLGPVTISELKSD